MKNVDIMPDGDVGGDHNAKVKKICAASFAKSGDLFAFVGRAVHGPGSRRT